jgi:predicted enzyme related to lactoylglutathione lyase
MLQNIQIISIPVTDQQAAKEFYLKLGFKLIVEAPMGPTGTWIQLGLPGDGATITLVNWYPQMPAGSVDGLVIGTDDIEGDVAALKAVGIIAEEIKETPWGRFVAIADPDGNSISLHQK